MRHQGASPQPESAASGPMGLCQGPPQRLNPMFGVCSSSPSVQTARIEPLHGPAHRLQSPPPGLPSDWLHEILDQSLKVGLTVPALYPGPH